MTPRYDYEDEVMPEKLAERWALRDKRYLRKGRPLSPGEVAAIREWRIAEAGDAGDMELLSAARLWEPPV